MIGSRHALRKVLTGQLEVGYGLPVDSMHVDPRGSEFP
jgi:hypothetical protein